MWSFRPSLRQTLARSWTCSRGRYGQRPTVIPRPAQRARAALRKGGGAFLLLVGKICEKATRQRVIDADMDELPSDAAAVGLFLSIAGGRDTSGLRRRGGAPMKATFISMLAISTKNQTSRNLSG